MNGTQRKLKIAEMGGIVLPKIDKEKLKKQNKHTKKLRFFNKN